MKVKYKLQEIHPKVFLVTMDNSYDLAMTFCRVQEFYESPYKEIRGKYFTMADFQRLYTMRRGDDCFTYPIDWAGFNVPSHIIDRCYGYYDSFKDINQYDDVLQGINHKITNSDINAKKYYLIGAQTGNQSTIDHEVAHAFYYLYSGYRKEANEIVEKLPEKLFNKFKKHLLGIGYNDKVIKDEIQAYLSADPENLTEINGTSERENNKINIASVKLKNLNKEYANRKI
jgi:hypothetical protein